jgi:signal transduction histidine kinase
VTIVPDLDESLTSDASTELLIYQIAREALTNAVKHASPTTIWITLRQLGGSVSMAVVDDGIGFDTASFRDDRHFGLELMKERASMLGGELLVSSHRGSGTTVSLVIEASGTA